MEEFAKKLCTEIFTFGNPLTIIMIHMIKVSKKTEIKIKGENLGKDWDVIWKNVKRKIKRRNSRKFLRKGLKVQSRTIVEKLMKVFFVVNSSEMAQFP